MTRARPEAVPRLWAVVGATGTGKSDLSLDLAEALAVRGVGAEIVNADAMQLYRGMDIGTAKIPADERRGIPHHLFDELDVTQDAAVAWYQPRARAAIEAILSRGADAILVGGSGLYVSSVLYDFRFPPRDEALRARLEAELEQHGAAPLLARLQEQDPATAARIDPMNGRRIVRALEVLAQGERTHGAALPEKPVLWAPRTRVLALGVERGALVERLDRRVERMWEHGMLAEVERLRADGLEQGTTARRAIGYAQALAQLAGTLDPGRGDRRDSGAHPPVRASPGVVVPPVRRRGVARRAGADRRPSHRGGEQMTAAFGIRAFHPDDTDAVVALWEDAGLTRPWNDPRADIERKLAVQPELFLVAEESVDDPGSAVHEARIVGSVMGGYDGHRGWLYYLASASDRRGAGIGRALVAEAERLLRAMGCPKVQLMVRPGNEQVLGFYDALGYERFEVGNTGKRLIHDA